MINDNMLPVTAVQCTCAWCSHSCRSGQIAYYVEQTVYIFSHMSYPVTGSFYNFHFTSSKLLPLLPAVMLKCDTLPEVILLPKCQTN